MCALLCADFTKFRKAQRNFVQIAITEYFTNQTIYIFNADTD